MLNIIIVFLIAFLIALSCTISGIFLVLRKMVLVGDAVSHSMLLGIVLVFLLTQASHSPLLLLGATLACFLTLFLINTLRKFKADFPDAIIATVYPTLFAIAVLLIYLFADKVHLDQDVVLLGELAFAPFYRWSLFGLDLGVVGLWSGFLCLLINTGWLLKNQRKIRYAIFDESAAKIAGLKIEKLFLGQLFVVCFTSVSAFDSVGVILVLAFFVLPVISAKLVVNSFWPLVVMSILFSSLGICIGLPLAFIFDLNLAASMVTILGLIFISTFLIYHFQKGRYQLY